MKNFTKEQDEILLKSSEVWYFRYKFKNHSATDNQIQNRRKYLLSLKRKVGKQIFKDNRNKEREIENFVYNGFMGNSLPGTAKYKAKFNKWMEDPGVVLMDCSDGKNRLIPTWAIIGRKKLPKQKIKINPNTGMAEVLFGSPSQS